MEKCAGSPNRTRTCDKSINSRLLYQLSYRGTRWQGAPYSKGSRGMASPKAEVLHNSVREETLL